MNHRFLVLFSPPKLLRWGKKESTLVGTCPAAKVSLGAQEWGSRGIQDNDSACKM